MKICFTLDDVIRAKTLQFGKIYKKYADKDINLESLDFSTNNYEKIFGFKTRNEYNKFLYEDYAFEIFSEAQVCEKMLDKKLNLWLLELQDDDEEIEVSISNPGEFNASIGYTCFFLSKIATRVRSMFFPLDSNDIWKNCDVLITADPKLLSSKPDGKISVRIETDYNKNCNADYSYAKLSEFLDDKEIVKKIKKTNE